MLDKNSLTESDEALAGTGAEDEHRLAWRVRACPVRPRTREAAEECSGAWPVPVHYPGLEQWSLTGGEGPLGGCYWHPGVRSGLLLSPDAQAPHSKECSGPKRQQRQCRETLIRSDTPREKRQDLKYLCSSDSQPFKTLCSDTVYTPKKWRTCSG